MRHVPDTSRAAHDRLDQAQRTKVHRRVLAAILHAPGTSRELAARTGLTYHQVERRCSELLQAGLAARGEKVRSPDTGRWAYRLVPVEPLARAWLASNEPLRKRCAAETLRSVSASQDDGGVRA